MGSSGSCEETQVACCSNANDERDFFQTSGSKMVKPGLDDSFWEGVTAQRPTSVVLDTDVGYGDIVAAGILARASPAPVKLVTVVHGMVPSTAKGACFMRRIFQRLTGMSPTVVCGASGPCNAEHEKNSVAKSEWGPAYQTGLVEFALRYLGTFDDDNVQDEKSGPSTLKAVPATLELLRASAHKSVDIVALGPLTNLSQLLKVGEDIVQSKVRRIWVMGGCLDCKGNAGPNGISELNFFADPVAAASVLGCAAIADKLRIIGLDVCNSSNPLSDTWAASIAKAQQDGIMSGAQAVNPATFLYEPVVAYACVVDGQGLEFKPEHVVVGPHGDLKRVESPQGERPPIQFAKAFEARGEYVHFLTALCAWNDWHLEDYCHEDST